MAFGTWHLRVLREASEMKLLDYLTQRCTPDKPRDEPYKGVDLCFCCEGTLEKHEDDCPQLRDFKP